MSSPEPNLPPRLHGEPATVPIEWTRARLLRMLAGPLVILLVAVFIALKLASIGGAGGASSIDNLPTYPNASGLQESTNSAAMSGAEAQAIPRSVTRFSTTDSPDKVFAFYKDVLEKKGWQSAKQSASSGAQVWSYLEPSPGEAGKAKAQHWVEVKTTREGQGTRVTVSKYRLDY